MASTKSKKPAKAAKEEVEIPVRPEASRLGESVRNKGLREALSHFWVIDGQPGLYNYSTGCAGTTEKHGTVTAQVNGAYALFTRDTEAERILRQVLGGGTGSADSEAA